MEVHDPLTLTESACEAEIGWDDVELKEEKAEPLFNPPHHSRRSQLEKALFIIRVGPVIGLVLSMSLGWLQSAFFLILTWLWVPITYTGRPILHLGTTVCHTMWAGGDMIKCTYILLYVYFIMSCLWWLAPSSTSANVGLISIGALPCVSNSCYRSLKAIGVTTVNTSKSTFTIIKSVLTPDRRTYLRRNRCSTPKDHLISKIDIITQESSVSIEDLNIKPVNANDNNAKTSDAKQTVNHKDNIVKMRKWKGIKSELLGFTVWMLCSILNVSQWTPRLNAMGNEANIYYGMEERHVEILRKNNTKVSFYTKLPWKPFSRLWGKAHNLYLPWFLRYIGLPFYIWLFSVDLKEAQLETVGQYRNLATFFKRRLKPGVRPIDSKNSLTSPADGRVLHLGPIENGLLEQIKGVTYSMYGFFGPPQGLYTGSQALEDLKNLSDEEYLHGLISRSGNVMWQCIIYLGPGDYHHIHSPTDWMVKARRHIPGELYSVQPSLARWLQGLFSFNERAVYTGHWKHGFFSMTAVGATNVGSIDIDFDQDLHTNVITQYSRNSYFDKSFDSPGQCPHTKDDNRNGVTVTKGERLGEFNLGSTLVLLFEAPRNFQFTVKPGDKLRYGQAIGNCLNPKE